MKRYIFSLILFIIAVSSIMAQAPDWVHIQKPKESNNTYFYQVIQIDNASTYNEALREATKLARWAGICHKRGWIYETTLERADFDNKEYIAVEKKCDYTENEYGKIVYYFLFQVSANDLPKFDYCDCNSTTIQDSILNATKELRQRAIRKIKAAAIPASVFVPGVGQMVKGQYVKGGLMLGGEVIGVGGIIASFAMKSSNETLIINDPKHQTEYAQRANSWQNVGYGFIGLAAAVYLYSLIDVIAARPTDEAINKKIESLAFTPIYSPIDNSLGIAMSINF
ncbi:MAG: hypothetical protein IKN91_08750 [Paludibacteraceae bacterium]|nr:hypothetical protein [Paludibacteraceae bacterium]